jgi:tetratricopeptide (TPR) repeat protein
MKNISLLTVKLAGVILMALLLMPAALQAQEKVPITTSFEEAQKLYMEGREQLEEFHFPQSIELLEKAIEKDPDFAMAHMLLAMAKGGGTQYEPKHLDKAVELSANVSDGEKNLIHLAQAFHDGDEKGLEKYSEALLNEYPEDERVLLWAGISYFTLEDYEHARKYFEKATQVNPNYHVAHNMLGYTMMAEGNMPMAEKAFKKYLELLPDNANAHDSYADFLKREGKFEESTAHYKKALEIDPKYVPSQKGLADNYVFMGDFKKAREHYRSYYKENNNTAVKFNGLLYEASVDLHEDNPDHALKVMDNYIKMAEDMNMPYYQVNGMAYKGYILTETGKPGEGLKQYRKAMDMIETADLTDKERMQMKNNSCIWEFYALLHNEDMTAADQAQDRCYNRLTNYGTSSDWKTFYRLSGIMEIQRGNYDQARDFFTDSWNDPVTWYYTGLSWQKEGDPVKARKYYQKVTQHYDNNISLGAVRNKAMAGLKE